MRDYILLKKFMSQHFYVPSVIAHTRDDGSKNVFTCLEKIGQGGFAVVYKVKHQNTNKTYAMKIISKRFIVSTRDKTTLEKLKNEIQIQKSLVHSNIVQSKISFSDEFNYYIVLEYCPGKNIREYLRDSTKCYLNEPETRKILKDVISGLFYIHNRKIIHYDLKLENFIIGSDGKVKIADFGLSTLLKKEQGKKNSYICGTPNYISPEILLKKDNGCSFSSDIWSIGIAAFIMLTGKAPFSASTTDAIYENIKNCQFTFPTDINLSYEAKDFIKSILKFDPNKRPTAYDLLKHPFIKKHDSEPIQLYKPNQTTTNAVPNTNKDHNIPMPIFNPNLEPIPNQIYANDYNVPEQIPNRNINQITSQFLPKYGNNPPSSTDNYPLKKSTLNGISEFHANKLIDANPKKTVQIPRNFVVKHSFLRDDLIYMLANGTVGICFGDKSRIVLDPNEEFAQYYKNSTSSVRVIDFKFQQSLNSGIDGKISLLKNFARSFKKFKNLYDHAVKSTFSSIPLHHVSSFIRKESDVLYRFSNKNIQADFADGKKLIIFSSAKDKICISNNSIEKFFSFSINDVNANSEEYIKYRKAKEMLNELTRNS